MARDLGFEPSNAEHGYYFISYNSEDFERVGAIAAELNAAGVKLWYDRGLEYGSRGWKEQISEKIAGCEGLLFFYTHGMIQKEHSGAKEEYDAAHTANKDDKVYIIPLDDMPDQLTIPYATNKLMFYTELTRRQRFPVAPDELNDPKKLAQRIIRELKLIKIKELPAEETETASQASALAKLTEERNNLLKHISDLKSELDDCYGCLDSIEQEIDEHLSEYSTISPEDFDDVFN